MEDASLVPDHSPAQVRGLLSMQGWCGHARQGLILGVGQNG